MNMLTAMEIAFNDAAIDQFNMAEEAEDTDDGLHNQHGLQYDDCLGMNDDNVMDVVDTPLAKRQRAILRRAGWLKEPEEVRGGPKESDLLAERMARARARGLIGTVTRIKKA